MQLIEKSVEVLKNLFKQPTHVPLAGLQQAQSLSDEEKFKLRKMGGFFANLQGVLQDANQTNYERITLARELERSTTHPLMIAAVETFADVATNFNKIEGASVWCTSDSTMYQQVITQFLESIGTEERIYDWATTLSTYGDLFLTVHGVPGQGITSIDDDLHPTTFSRVDREGRLIGFFETPMTDTSQEATLLPPWKLCHFRLLGAKKRRPPMMQGQTYSSYDTVSLLGATDTQRVTTKYGTSILTNALPTYRRLRLAEDSLLLTRDVPWNQRNRM